MSKMNSLLPLSSCDAHTVKRTVLGLFAAAALAAGGCAQETAYVASHVSGPDPVRSHDASLPVGTIPVLRGAADDPSEPFSPNYGAIPLTKADEAADGTLYKKPFDRSYEARPLADVEELPDLPERRPESGTRSVAGAPLDPDRIIARAKEQHGWRIW